MDLFIWIPILFVVIVSMIGTLSNNKENTIGLQMIGFLGMLILPCVGYLIMYM